MTIDNNTVPVPSLERIRHPFRARHLQLVARELVSPGVMRITLHSPEPLNLTSSGFDDHFKLILPVAGYEKPPLPQMIDGKPFIEGTKPVMRDYTPLRWTEHTLWVDFVIGHAGPATEWACSAPLGQWVGAAGPRGSLVVHPVFSQYWLFADATGLPAVQRAITELPATAPLVIRLAVNPQDRRPLDLPFSVDLQWVDQLTDAVDGIDHFPTSSFIWAAGEHHDMTQLRQAILAKGADPKNTRISAYWRQGDQAHHAEITHETPAHGHANN